MEAIKTDWRQATLSQPQRAMLAFSEKLTRTPAEMTAEDSAGLRAQGFSDEQILALVLLAGFFNLATRLADALGIELDPEFIRGTPEYEKFMQG